MKIDTSDTRTQVILVCLIIIAVLGGLAIRSRYETDKNVIGIVLDVEYEDGEHLIIDPTTWTSGLTVSKLAITDTSGKLVKAATFALKTKTDWDGTLSDYNFEGTLDIYYNGNRQHSTTIRKPSKIEKGSYQVIATYGVGSAMIESWVDRKVG
ncbi:unnamed protein product, partial [marine sediment metagenome]